MQIQPQPGFGGRQRQRAAMSGPPAFQPDALSGLALWLDAADAATITSSMGAVSQWSDKSGNGHHATQGTGASQPLTGAATLNGLNTITFDGTNDFLNYDGSILAGTNYTFFFVHKAANFSSNYVLGGNVRSANRNFHLRYSNSGQINFSQYGNDIYATVATMSAADGRLLSGRLASSGRQFFLNGAVIGSTATATQLIDYTGAAIGRMRESSGLVYSAEYAAEYIVYNRDLSDAEIGQVHSYLMDKWGLL